MEGRWRAREQSGAAFEDGAIVARVREMAGFEPYDRVGKVESKLREYWEGVLGYEDAVGGRLCMV